MPNKLDWQKAICPVCGKEYLYLPSYKPATCGTFDCMFAHMHPQAVKRREVRLSQLSDNYYRNSKSNRKEET